MFKFHIFSYFINPNNKSASISVYLAVFLLISFFSNNIHAESLIGIAQSLREESEKRNEVAVQSTQADKIATDTTDDATDAENDTDKTVIIDEELNKDLSKETTNQNEVQPKKRVKRSVMLTGEELGKVEDAIDAFFNNRTLTNEDITEQDASQDDGIETPIEDIKIKEQSQIYLDAIFYLDKSNWITWINGNKITSESNSSKDSIYIKSIDQDKAKIEWKMGISKWKALTGKTAVDQSVYKMDQETNQIQVDFTLRTNQTYNLSDNLVTEGKTNSSKDLSIKGIKEDLDKGLNKLDKTLDKNLNKLKQLF